jgi:S-DNA-T family DNA segregation ATPase FtsK/SpoIIIE
MATRAPRAEPADWRATFRRSAARALQLTGAVALYLASGVLLLALVSYHQTDPSFSTAASGPPLNWMGYPGAWTADMALLGFGVVSVLLLPLLYAFARKLWRDAENEETPHGRRWWRTVAMLIVGMALLCTVLGLVFDPQGGSLPASFGGLAGLLGAKAIAALAHRLPQAAQVWAIGGLGLACLAGGAALVGRVFAFDWAQLLTLPHALKRAPALPDNPFKPAREKRVREPRPEVEAEIANRKPPEISDPSRPPKPARLGGKAKQKDLFETYQLPSLDLLEDPAPDKGPKLDKLALERNARLLETVLDDFNV